MAYVNNIIPKGTLTPIATDGNYIFFNTERTLINITVYSGDGTTIERHPMETIAVLNLVAGDKVKVNADVYMVSLAGGSAVPSPDPKKLDVSVYNADKPTFALKTNLNSDQTALLTKLNAALTAISGAADFNAAKTALKALLPINRTDV